MNDCSHFDEATRHRFYDGELEDREAKRFATHLEACPTCRASLDGLASLSLRLASAGDDVLSDGWAATFMDRARDMQLQRSRRIAWGLVAAASFLLVTSMCLVGYSMRDGGATPVFTAQWEENVVAPPVVEEEFVDLNTRTLVAIHIQDNAKSENGNE